VFVNVQESFDYGGPVIRTRPDCYRTDCWTVRPTDLPLGPGVRKPDAPVVDGAESEAGAGHGAHALVRVGQALLDEPACAGVFGSFVYGCIDPCRWFCLSVASLVPIFQLRNTTQYNTTQKDATQRNATQHPPHQRRPALRRDSCPCPCPCPRHRRPPLQQLLHHLEALQARVLVLPARQRPTQHAPHQPLHSFWERAEQAPVPPCDAAQEEESVLPVEEEQRRAGRRGGSGSGRGSEELIEESRRLALVVVVIAAVEEQGLEGPERAGVAGLHGPGQRMGDVVPGACGKFDGGTWRVVEVAHGSVKQRVK
jgi:hypothetical protein